MLRPKQSTPPSADFPRPALVPTGRHDTWPPFSLDRPVTLIGSRQRAHIRLESDEVSRSHAVVVNADGRVIIRDLASRTHLFVNGRQVREAVLEEGDHINIGHFALRFAAGEPALPLDVDDDPDDGATRGASAVLTGDGVDAGGVGLGRALCVVGCRRGVDLVLRGSEVSFAHALIFWEVGRHFVRDLGSRAGTFLDGTAVEGDAELRPGSVLRIGPYRLRYSMPGVAPAAAAVHVEAVGMARAATQRMPEMPAAAETWFPPSESEPKIVAKVKAPPAAALESAEIQRSLPAAVPPATQPTSGLPPALVEADPVPAPLTEVDRPDAPSRAAPAPVAQEQTPNVTVTVHSGHANPEPTDNPADEFEFAEAATIDPTPVATEAPDQPTFETPRADPRDAPGAYEPIGLALGGQILVDEVVVPAIQFEPPVYVVASMKEAPAPAAHADATAPIDEAPPADDAEVQAEAPAEALAAEAGGPADDVDDIGAVLDALEGHLATPVADERQGDFFADTAAGVEPEPEAPEISYSDRDASDEISTDAAVSLPVGESKGEVEYEPESEYEKELEYEQEPAPLTQPIAAEIKPSPRVPVRPPSGPATARPGLFRPESVAPPPPPQTWGVLAAAVALAETPHAHEARVAAAEDRRPPRRGRGWLKFIAALILVAAVAGVVFVFLKTDATAAIRRHL